MCLSVAIYRPDDVLSKGDHLGFEWMVVHNGSGYRCGYVKLPPGHPWRDLPLEDDRVSVHGGITFSEPDEPCGKGGPDDGYWLGFDCAHGGDAPDPLLPQESPHPFASMYLGRRGEVRSQEYVESECRSLCEQAEAVS